jgi:6,7-dimethyl-8-ribityllumazine synthase
MKLPVIVERNSWTLPQERYNTEWVEENRVGVVVSNFDGIVEAIRKLPLEEYRANAAKLENRAVFEVPGMLARILEAGS